MEPPDELQPRSTTESALKEATNHPGWLKGPLPPNTWFWGGVVPKGHDNPYGFYFADFCGDSVKMYNDFDMHKFVVLKAEDVVWYNNALDLPPDRMFGTGPMTITEE